MALHDRGEYADAVRRYQEVLAADPGNLVALFEISTTEMARGHYQEATEYARAGLRCPSPYRLMFYVSLGSALDDMKKPDEAIAAYKDGLKEAAATERQGPPGPQHLRSKELLLFNLSTCLVRAGRPDESRSYAEQAALLLPDHASPYLVLGTVHEQLRNRIPALLALLRFVSLEPTTERAKSASKQIL